LNILRCLFIVATDMESSRREHESETNTDSLFFVFFVSSW